jgi:hypothetical protein
MRRRAQAVKDRMASGNFTKSFALGGKNTIVQPGKEITVRLAPRWDYAQSVVLDQATRKYVPNPAYQGGLSYVYALEHWWEGEAGRWSHEWCPRIFDERTQCAVCDAAAALMASGAKEDREYGKKLQAKEAFIFNAVVGDPRLVGQDGLADIRIISLSGTQFNAVSDIMTGGENEKAAFGDITNSRDGYDLTFKRPVAGGNDRWSVRPLPNPSPLYDKSQAAAFKGWVTRLVDLEKMLSDETKDAAGIFRAYYGRDPAPDELSGEPAITGPGETPAVIPLPQPPTGFAPPQDADPGDVGGAESAAEPESPDDAFMPPPPASQRPARSPVTPPGPGARTAPRVARLPRR